MTYMRVKEHLEKKYGVHFGYGAIVQLCCVKNKRWLSAKRYFGMAKIVLRRVRKGFTIKLNVDAHWSCSFYKTLDFLQLKDGRDTVVLNRDDAICMAFVWIQHSHTSSTSLGVVKAHNVHKKNSTQHAADLEMLETFEVVFLGALIASE